MSDSPSEPEFTARASVQAKIKLAERLIETASEQLRDLSQAAPRRAELEKLLEDMRRDLSRFEKQKEELDS
jgi:hypothetical protein